jgi:hypothetical protein
MKYFLWNLRSSGVLRSVEWQSFTDVSGKRIGPLFKGQEIFLEFLTLEDGTETSVKEYHSTLLNNPEERRSHQHRRLKPEITNLFSNIPRYLVLKLQSCLGRQMLWRKSFFFKTFVRINSEYLFSFLFNLWSTTGHPSIQAYEFLYTRT